MASVGVISNCKQKAVVKRPTEAETFVNTSNNQSIIIANEWESFYKFYNNSMNAAYNSKNFSFMYTSFFQNLDGILQSNDIHNIYITYSSEIEQRMASGKNRNLTILPILDTNGMKMLEKYATITVLH